MLAAAEILGNSTLSAQYGRRLVFAAFAGEPWGYMGSKRFLWELHTGENSTRPLTLAAIDQVPSCSREACCIVSMALMGSERFLRKLHSGRHAVHLLSLQVISCTPVK